MDICTHEDTETWEQDGQIYTACLNCHKVRESSVDELKAMLPRCRDLAETYRSKERQDLQGGVVIIFYEITVTLPLQCRYS